MEVLEIAKWPINGPPIASMKPQLKLNHPSWGMTNIPTMSLNYHHPFKTQISPEFHFWFPFLSMAQWSNHLRKFLPTFGPSSGITWGFLRLKVYNILSHWLEKPHLGEVIMPRCIITLKLEVFICLALDRLANQIGINYVNWSINQINSVSMIDFKFLKISVMS